MSYYLPLSLILALTVEEIMACGVEDGNDLEVVEEWEIIPGYLF